MTPEVRGTHWWWPAEEDRPPGFGVDADLPVLASPFRLVPYDVVGSTNEEARLLADRGAPDSTVVWALEQSQGRGRRGRAWTSPRGNLSVTYLFRPECSPARAAEYSFLAANAVADTIQSFVHRSTRVTVKWPNDVLVEGAKVAGILLESAASGPDRLDWLAVGIGVNIRHRPEAAAYPCTDLSREIASDVTAARFLERLTRYMAGGLCSRRRVGFAAVRRDWLNRAQGIGQPIRCRLMDREEEGLFKGLAGDGSLLLEKADGSVETIVAGEVYWPDEPTPVKPEKG